ncbi:MAG: hypothetical protein QM658_07450 [Gordonia sp. (in: high G+C Gram-positive bacteria)]
MHPQQPPPGYGPGQPAPAASGGADVVATLRRIPPFPTVLAFFVLVGLIFGIAGGCGSGDSTSSSAATETTPQSSLCSAYEKARKAVYDDEGSYTSTINRLSRIAKADSRSGVRSDGRELDALTYFTEADFAAASRNIAAVC